MTVTSTSSQYVQDILSQPERLHQLADARSWQVASKLASQKFDRLVLTGMGASLFALLPAWQQLVRADRPAWLIETGELLHSLDGLITERTLVIAASQSGYSAEVVSLTQRQPALGGLVALTNDPTSPLSESADITIAIHSGEEHAVSTRSYLNTVGAAAGLTSVLLGTPDPAPQLHAAGESLTCYLHSWEERVGRLEESIGLPERLYIVGRGASLAAAQCGALILKEAAKWPAEAMSGGQFRHGPLELADDRLTVIILAGHSDEDRGRNHHLAADLRRFGGRVVWADAEQSGPEPALSLASGTDGLERALAETVGLQLTSVSIAQQAGVETGVFRHLEKITTVE